MLWIKNNAQDNPDRFSLSYYANMILRVQVFHKSKQVLFEDSKMSIKKKRTERIFDEHKFHCFPLVLTLPSLPVGEKRGKLLGQVTFHFC